jgi:hypothetical protein
VKGREEEVEGGGWEGDQREGLWRLSPLMLSSHVAASSMLEPGGGLAGRGREWAQSPLPGWRGVGGLEALWA